MKFEYWGIFCRHILKVLDLKNFKLIPKKYILKRWTKVAKLGCVENITGSTIEEDPKLAIKNRYRELSRNAIKLTTWAAEIEEGCVVLNRIFREAMVELERISLRKVGQINYETV